nr:hypothetical protein [Tanacetum cinerariifolium]
MESHGGTEAAIPLKTTKQKIARRNELKVKSTPLLAIPDEHLLKFHRIKDAKTLWEAIKTRFGGNKESKKMQKTIMKQQYENFVASRSEGLDKTYDRFQKLISQLEIHGEVISQEDENLKLLRSLPPAWNTHTLIMRNKSNLDTLSMDDLYNNLKVYEAEIKGQSSSNSNSQNDNDNMEQIDTDDLVEMDLPWWEPRSQVNRNGDNTTRVVPMETPVNALVVTDGMGLELLEARIVVHQKNEAVFEEDIAFLKYDVKVRDNSITELKNQLEGSLKEKYDLKLKLEKFKTSSKNLTNLINSQISPKDKTGLSYDSQLSERDLNNKSDVFESASDSSVNKSEEDNNQANDRYKADEGYHAVPPPYTGNFMPSRPDMSFAGLDESVFKSAISKTVTSVHKTETSISKTSKETMEKPKTVRSSAPVIEDWESNSDDDYENTRKYVIEQHTYKQAENLRKSQNSRVDKRDWNEMMTQKLGDGFEFKKKSYFGNPQYTLKDQWIFDSGCSRHMEGNKSFFTEYQEIDSGFVAFEGSPKGGKISRKGKIRTGKLDFEDVY